jgi:hypothetical protein
MRLAQSSDSACPRYGSDLPASNGSDVTISVIPVVPICSKQARAAQMAVPQSLDSALAHELSLSRRQLEHALAQVSDTLDGKRPLIHSLLAPNDGSAFASACANFPCDGGHGEEAAQVLGHVEMRFIKRKRFDQRCIIDEDGADLLRHRAVNFEPRRQKHQFAAESHRRGGRYCGADARFAGFVTCRGDQPALGARAHSSGRPRSAGLSRCSTDA